MLLGSPPQAWTCVSSPRCSLTWRVKKGGSCHEPKEQAWTQLHLDGADRQPTDRRGRGAPAGRACWRPGVHQRSPKARAREGSWAQQRARRAPRGRSAASWAAGTGVGCESCWNRGEEDGAARGLAGQGACPGQRPRKARSHRDAQLTLKEMRPGAGRSRVHTLVSTRRRCPPLRLCDPSAGAGARVGPRFGAFWQERWG